MYARDDVVRVQQRGAKKALDRNKMIVRNVIVTSRRTGQPLPDALAARYPTLVGQLGDPEPQYIELPDLGLGFALPAVLKFGSVISKVPVIGGLFKGSTKGLNANRFAQHTSLMNRARAGDVAAYDQLKAFSKPGARPHDAWRDAASKLAQVTDPRLKPAVKPAGTTTARPVAPKPLPVSQRAPAPKPSGGPSWLNSIVDLIQGQKPGAAPQSPSYGGGGPSYSEGPSQVAPEGTQQAGAAGGIGGISPVVLIAGAAGLYFLTRSGGSRRW